MTKMSNLLKILLLIVLGVSSEWSMAQDKLLKSGCYTWIAQQDGQVKKDKAYIKVDGNNITLVYRWYHIPCVLKGRSLEGYFEGNGSIINLSLSVDSASKLSGSYRCVSDSSYVTSKIELQEDTSVQSQTDWARYFKNQEKRPFVKRPLGDYAKSREINARLAKQLGGDIVINVKVRVVDPYDRPVGGAYINIIILQYNANTLRGIFNYGKGLKADKDGMFEVKGISGHTLTIICRQKGCKTLEKVFENRSELEKINGTLIEIKLEPKENKNNKEFK